MAKRRKNPSDEERRRREREYLAWGTPDRRAIWQRDLIRRRGISGITPLARQHVARYAYPVLEETVHGHALTCPQCRPLIEAAERQLADQLAQGSYTPEHAERVMTIPATHVVQHALHETTYLSSPATPMLIEILAGLLAWTFESETAKGGRDGYVDVERRRSAV